jgi:hypothetical protein
MKDVKGDGKKGRKGGKKAAETSESSDDEDYEDSEQDSEPEQKRGKGKNLYTCSNTQYSAVFDCLAWCLA